MVYNFNLHKDFGNSFLNRSSLTEPCILKFMTKNPDNSSSNSCLVIPSTIDTVELRFKPNSIYVVWPKKKSSLLKKHIKIL